MLRSWTRSIWKYKQEIILAASLLFTREVNITRYFGGDVVNNYRDIILSPAIVVLSAYLIMQYKKIPLWVWGLVACNVFIIWPDFDWARGYSFLHSMVILFSWLFLVRSHTWKRIGWSLPLVGLFDHALMSSAYPILIVLVFQRLYEVKRLLFLQPVLLMQLSLGIWQSFTGRSLGLHIVGEKHLNLNTAGVAKTVVEGVEVLRGYGTFAHPIIFGFLFLVASSFLSHQKWAYYAGACISQSRAVIGSLLCKIKNKKVFIMVFTSMLLLVSIRIFTSDIYRYQDVTNWWQFVRDNPWQIVIGTGLGQYPFELQQYDLHSFQYQPVHSTLLLLIIEAGVLPVTISFIKLWKNRLKIFNYNNV